MSFLTSVHAKVGQFEEARRCIGKAIAASEASKEAWCDAEIRRIAGEIALLSPASDTVRAEAHFERALAIARKQQAKSFELRAAMSMARLWRDQGKKADARDLLAPASFTEGFDRFATLNRSGRKPLLRTLAKAVSAKEIKAPARFWNGFGRGITGHDI
jgi:predicted ATPase